jgi:hypothetical protein
MSIEKPDFLYHGSPNKEIDRIEPRKKFVRDKNEDYNGLANLDNHIRWV